MNPRSPDRAPERVTTPGEPIDAGWTSACLQELAEIDKNVEPPRRIEEALMARWDARVTDRGRRLTRRIVPALAVAVIVLAAWAVIGLREPPVSIPRSAGPGPIELGTPSRHVPASEPRDALAEKTRLERRGRSHRPLELPIAPPAEPGVAGFIPLDPLGDMMEGDEMQMFRVRLSRAALPSLGVPIDDSVAGGDIEADVWLGQDGFARAIRFVK